MKIISDTGPLIGLAKIDRLPILKEIAAEILIPPMVYRELLGKIGAESERIDRALANFIRKVELNPPISPIILALAFLIKREDGVPVFYRGVRVGRYGKLFRIFKFRTMVVKAEKIGGSLTADDDPRITRIGKFIRKYKLDEIPQHMNGLQSAWG